MLYTSGRWKICRDFILSSGIRWHVEEIAFLEKDIEDDGLESNADNPMIEIDDFDYRVLLDENSDCIGWLKIDGTDISYLVVQGKDNEFYLHHDFQKNYAICGTLMLDCRKVIDISQENLIIYGYQMKDGSMFKQLNRYKKKNFIISIRRSRYI